MFKFSKTSLRRRQGIDSRLIEINDLALTLSTIDFGIPKFGGWRSPDDQHELFLLEKSKCDGHKRLSKHQLGRALDFYAYVDGKASWNKEHLAIVAAAHLQAACKLGYILEWGGLWKKYIDMPHLQLAKG